MIKTKEVVGLPVIVLNDGNQIGKVKDIYFDNSSRKVVAIEMAEKAGLFKKVESFILIDKIHSIGKDAVTVEEVDHSVGSEVSKELGDYKASSLIGRNILLENGSTIGKIGEINFNFPEGDILSFAINDPKNSLFGGEKGTIDIQKVRAIGKDALIVFNQQ